MSGPLGHVFRFFFLPSSPRKVSSEAAVREAMEPVGVPAEAEREQGVGGWSSGTVGKSGRLIKRPSLKRLGCSRKPSVDSHYVSPGVLLVAFFFTARSPSSLPQLFPPPLPPSEVTLFSFLCPLIQAFIVPRSSPLLLTPLSLRVLIAGALLTTAANWPVLHSCEDDDD